MTEFWRTAKLCTAFFGCLCIVVLVSILREPVSAKTAYSVRVYTFAPKATLSPDFVDWDTSSPVATDGRGDVAFVVDKYLDTFSAVVWHADGSVSTIAPPRADLAEAFRIYDIGPHGEKEYPEPHFSAGLSPSRTDSRSAVPMVASKEASGFFSPAGSHCLESSAPMILTTTGSRPATEPSSRSSVKTRAAPCHRTTSSRHTIGIRSLVCTMVETCTGLAVGPSRR
jgi:hypothetical protein